MWRTAASESDLRSENIYSAAPYLFSSLALLHKLRVIGPMKGRGSNVFKASQLKFFDPFVRTLNVHSKES